jgi:hypothetical protein
MTRYYLGIKVDVIPPTTSLEPGWVWAWWPDGRCFKHWADQLETTPWGGK